MSDSPFGPNAKYDQFYKIPSLTTAHGTLMGLTFVVILPLGSIIIRLVKSKHGVWIHAACQMIGWVLMLAGLAKGIQLADIVDIVSMSPHSCSHWLLMIRLVWKTPYRHRRGSRCSPHPTARLWLHPPQTIQGQAKADAVDYSSRLVWTFVSDVRPHKWRSGIGSCQRYSSVQ